MKEHVTATILELTQLIVFTIIILGCAPIATEYVPKDSNKLRLSVNNSRLGLEKDGAFAGLGSNAKLGRGLEMLHLTNCHPDVEQKARHAKGRFNQSHITGYLAGLVPITSPFLIPLSVKFGHEAVSAAIDAINMHNDIPECIAPPEPEPTKQTDGTDSKDAATSKPMNMLDLKTALHAGKITPEEYRQQQAHIRMLYREELIKAEQEYDADKMTRDEYKQTVLGIRKKYEGR